MEESSIGSMSQPWWVLGAASFGSEYGLANDAPTSKEEVGRILNLAREHNLTAIDTAQNYGESEKFLGSHELDGFKIYTKVSSSSLHNSIFEDTLDSLNRLNISTLHGLTLHDTTVFMKGEAISTKSIDQLKERGLVHLWGVSVYDVDELEEVLKFCSPDYVQAPVSIFDTRFLSPRLTDLLQSRDIRLQARSVLLQGLLAGTSQARNPYFWPWAKELEVLTQLARQCGLSLAHLAFAFVSQLTQVESVVLGIASVDHLRDLISFLESSSEDRPVAFPEFQFDRDLADPRTWPRF